MVKILLISSRPGTKIQKDLSIVVHIFKNQGSVVTHQKTCLPAVAVPRIRRPPQPRSVIVVVVILGS